MEIAVSVIVPVYNSEEFLYKCISSLIKQTLQDIEIIFINDGSTDGSLKVLKKYEKLDKRIIVINQENKGPSAARNVGIKVAKGEYVSFIDSDDWVEEEMYSSMYKIAKENISDVVICDMAIINKNEKITDLTIDFNINDCSKKKVKQYIFNRLLSSSNFNSMANKLFKTSIIKENNIMLNEEIFYGEDWLFNINFFKVCNNIFYLNKCFYYYRRGHESSSCIYKENTFDDNGLWLYKQRKKYAKELGLEESLGCEELYNLVIHCIISELKSEKSTLSEKIRRINYIISTPEVRESINNLDKKKMSFKNKIIYKIIDNKMISSLVIYYNFGRLKSLYSRLEKRIL